MTPVEDTASLACGCDRHAAKGGLVSVDEALAIIGREVRPVTGRETLPLAAALGRVLAGEVRAAAAMPRFDNAGMDGYALRLADLQGAGPWELPVAGTLRAGDGRGLALPPGAAFRIFTGAPVPTDADAVVMQEETEPTGAGIRLRRIPAPGANIRRRGEDQAEGARVLAAGARLGPREIGAAAAAGAGHLRVRRRPRVALLTTGDELAPAGAALTEGAIWDVNTPMMQAAVEAAGAVHVACHAAPDRLEDTLALLARLSEQADLLLTTGGVSVGAADFIAPALARLGGASCFAGVAIKPGKPVTLARLGPALVLALPGNPLSAFVVWQVLGLPLLGHLAGATAQRPPIRVTSAEPIRHRPGRTEYRPARWRDPGALTVEVAAAVHSGRIASLAAADGVVRLPAGSETIAPGTPLEFLPFTC
jgi:molybdopterin molybdotransferase